jgi:hypothetical protein
LFPGLTTATFKVTKVDAWVQSGRAAAKADRANADKAAQEI